MEFGEQSSQEIRSNLPSTIYGLLDVTDLIAHPIVTTQMRAFT